MYTNAGARGRLRAPVRAAAAVVAVLLGAVAQSDTPPVATAEPAGFPEGVHDTLAKRVAASESAAYHAILDEFDRHLTAHPADAVAAVEKCKFIANFTESDDGPYVESAETDLESCRTDLEDAAVATNEVVKLYAAESKWGDAGAKAGEALLKEADANHWTAAHRAALHEHLQGIYRSTDKKGVKAGEHALAAVELNPASTSRLAAAEYLVRIGAKTRAVALLRPSDTTKWNEWQLETVAGLLVNAGAVPLAREVIEKQQSAKLTLRMRVILARLLAKAGEVAAARELLAKAAPDADSGNASTVDVLRDRFHLERDFGDRDAANAAYRALRRKGFSADPLARDRLSLFVAHPGLPVTGGDVLGLLALVLTLGFCALLPAVIVAPIHYRSLVKQSHGVPLPPPTPWGLGHLWYALATMVVAGVIAVYVYDYALLQAAFAQGSHTAGDSSDAGTSFDLGRALLLQAILTLVGVAPLLASQAQRQALRGQWSVAKSVFAGVGASIGFLMSVGSVVLLFKSHHGAASTGALGSVTTQSLQGLQAQYGLAVAVALVCVIVPFVEEVIFRGVFLQAAGRRLALWTAVLLQAIVFAALHEEPAVLPVIFALALLTAWLARRSGGLLAPIVCHGTNNAIALLAITRVTAALNGN